MAGHLLCDSPVRSNQHSRADGGNGGSVERASRHVPAIPCIRERRRNRAGKRTVSERKGYVDVYHHYGHLGERSILITRTPIESFQLLHDTGTAISHCPTSNPFLAVACSVSRMPWMKSAQFASAWLPTLVQEPTSPSWSP